MSKPTILFSKWGCAFWTNEARAARKGSRAARGDLGDTEGILRHLLARKEIQVVYYGRYRGEPLPGLVVVQPESTLHLDEWATAREQHAALAEDFDRLPKADYRFALSNLGPMGSWFMIDNPAAATIRASDIQHRSPWAYAIESLELPHAITCNDIRNAHQLRFGEFNDSHPHIIPIAWLDQTDVTRFKVIQGVRWMQQPVKANVETWTALPDKIKTDKTRDCVLIAHAHIQTGNCQPERDLVWKNILSGKVPPKLEVFGEGWQHYSGARSHITFNPPCPSPDAWQLFAESVCSPFVAPVTGYATNKPAFMARQECIPLPYGDGGPFTAEQVLPLNSPWRIVKPDDLDRVVREIKRDAALRLDLLHRARRAMRPNWKKLDRLVDDLLACDDPRLFKTNKWLVEYGGMRRV